MASTDIKYTLTLHDLFTKKMGDAINQTKRLDNSVDSLGSKLKTLAGGIATALAVKDIVQTTAKFQSFDNAINASSRSAEDGQKNIKFLNDQIDRLGLDINAAYTGYKTFNGALMGSALAGEQANNIFRQISESTTVMGLTGEQTEGAFLALGQMISKGKVQAEELRGQLGERIPGAFQIAARAMNMTTAELDKFMADGKLIATDFLPKFGAEMEKTFGQKVGSASQSLQANLNRMWAEFERLKVQIGNDFLPVIIQVTKAVASFFRWIKNNLGTIKLLGGIILGVVTAMKAYQAITAAIAIFNGAKLLFSIISLSAGLQGATVAQYALNTAMSLNPVAAVVLAVMALVAALGYVIANYRSIEELHSDQLNKNKIKGIEDETKAVRFLADAYMKHGRTKAEAQKMALRDSKQMLVSELAVMKTQLANATTDSQRRILEDRMATATGRLQALTDGSIFGEKNTGNANSIASTTQSSLGTSTEVTSNRPQDLTIHITKLVETLSVKTETMKEGAVEIRKMVADALLEAVNDINLITK